MNFYKYVNTYMMFKMRNHKLEYGMSWLNLVEDTETEAIKSYKRYVKAIK